MVESWTSGRFIFRSSFDTGRGVITSDLNSRTLEQIYQGLKADVGQEEATNFVNFVHELKDLSAAAFIQAFEQFWSDGCKEIENKQDESSGNHLTGTDVAELMAEGMILIASAFCTEIPDRNEIERLSADLKRSFILSHEKELTKPLHSSSFEDTSYGHAY